MISFLVTRESAFGVRHYLAQEGRDLRERMSVVEYEELPNCRSLPAGTWIFASLDQLSSRGMGLAMELEAQVRANPAVRVLNAPSRALLRRPLLEKLYGEGLNHHRAASAADDFSTLRFPVFVREEHQHTGALSALLHTPAELVDALGRLILLGYTLRDLLVVEYCETIDPEGYHRRYPCFVVGSEIIPRGLSRGRSWMLKLEDCEFTSESLAEERGYVLGNPHEQELRGIFELAGIQYGRIDYGVKDGRVETWEINLNPTIGLPPGERLAHLPEVLEPVRRVAMDHFHRRFHSALLGLDRTAQGAAPIAISYSDELRRDQRSLVRPRRTPGLRPGVARILRPVRPLLDRIVHAAAPLLLKRARRIPS